MKQLPTSSEAACERYIFNPDPVPWEFHSIVCRACGDTLTLDVCASCVHLCPRLKRPAADRIVCTCGATWKGKVDSISHLTISVIVCTRDRPEQLGPTLRAILASTCREFELVVIDQSTRPDSANLVRILAEHDVRLRLVRDSNQGLSRARNRGIAESTGEIIVFTDDDCEPETEWLGTLVAAMNADPEAGIAFGSVIPAKCDAHRGFIVGYVPHKTERLTHCTAKLLDGGIGANMALRRSTLSRSGEFDVMLGAGGYFPSCEDGDMAYRELKSGYALLHVPDARVLHRGFRTWQSGSALTRRTYLAVAATYTKHARAHDVVGMWLLLQQVWLALMNIADCVGHLRRPIGFGRLSALLVGVRRSFELEVDPRSGLYKPH